MEAKTWIPEEIWETVARGKPKGERSRELTRRRNSGRELGLCHASVIG